MCLISEFDTPCEELVQTSKDCAPAANGAGAEVVEEDQAPTYLRGCESPREWLSTPTRFPSPSSAPPVTQLFDEIRLPAFDRLINESDSVPDFLRGCESPRFEMTAWPHRLAGIEVPQARRAEEPQHKLDEQWQHWMQKSFSDEVGSDSTTTPRAARLSSKDSCEYWVHFIQVGWSGGRGADGGFQNLFKQHVLDLGLPCEMHRYHYFIQAPDGDAAWLEEELGAIAQHVHSTRPYSRTESHAVRRHKRTRVRIQDLYAVRAQNESDPGWVDLQRARQLAKGDYEKPEA